MSRRVHIDDPHERQKWIEGRRERLELVREAGWGQVSWLGVAAGVLTAIGAFALCVGVAAAVLSPMGLGLDGLSDNAWKTVGLGAGLGAAGALLGAFAFGGYVAGRMARRAGLRHGVLVFAVGLAVLAAAAGIAQLEDGLSAIRDRVESVGAPTGNGVWGGVAVITGAAAVAGMLLGSLLGGVRGERWHQRLIARALDPDIGPEADLRADVDAQRKAAAEALERAQKAGVLNSDGEPMAVENEPDTLDATRSDENLFWRDEPEPTSVGRSMPPSSRSSGP
jgi:hypothetical protein